MKHEDECGAHVPLNDSLGLPGDVVGHKTLYSPDTGYYHEPLTRAEAAALWDRCEAETKRRQEAIPDEAAALKTFFDAYLRLKELGWNDAMYCPKDGSTFNVIEAGSTGIHRCHYEGDWPTGGWMVHGEDDLWPSHPVLFKA